MRIEYSIPMFCYSNLYQVVRMHQRRIVSVPRSAWDGSYPVVETDEMAHELSRLLISWPTQLRHCAFPESPCFRGSSGWKCIQKGTQPRPFPSP